MFAEIASLLALAVGLSADAFAVTVSDTLCYKLSRGKKALLPAMFGLFQGLMPLIGYFLAGLFAGYIESIDHWVAFILLAALGVKMIVESVKEARKGEDVGTEKSLTFWEIVVQAVATSIDALAVGITFALADGQIPIFINVAVIALVTAALCTAALFVGKVGKLFKDKAGIVGGVILILIGVKILLEHLLGL